MNESEEIKRPINLLINAVINAVVSLAFSARWPEALEGFRGLFVGFGAQLGTATRLVLATPYLWAFLALVAIALLVWVGTRSRTTRTEVRRMKIAVRGFTVAMGLTLGFATLALYLPIFKLGAAT
jgi:hypothetical protein